MIPRIGIDIGDVIMYGGNTYFTDEYLQTKPFYGALSAVREIVARYKPENTFIISKCGETNKRKSLEIFDHWDFYRRTGFVRSDEHLLFCRQTHQKAPIAKDLELTCFIDNKRQVLEPMRDIVEHLVLFGPQGRPVPTGMLWLRRWSEHRLVLP